MTSFADDIRVHGFADSFGYARRMARALDASAARIATHRFPDGETLVRVATPPGRRAVLVRSLADPNQKLIETMLAADALRHAGAERVTLAAPYLPYMRQDSVFHPGEPISQRVIGAMLGRAFDAVVTINPHLHRITSLAEVFPCDARAISAAPALARWMKAIRGDCIVVGPDSESREFAQAIADGAGRRCVIGEKTRRGDRRVSVTFAQEIDASHAVIVDDIASSGVTLAAVASALRRGGVRTIDAVVVHAIFAPDAMRTIRRAGVRRILSCDTIAHASNAIATAPLMAQAIREVR
jgi:ribose-phosphate pyrophosphokinase